MADPASQYYIPDSSIQASSEYNSDHKAIYGRLHPSTHYWVPADADAQPWIEADLDHLVNVYGIQTQGAADGFFYCVTTLKVSTFQQEPGAGDSGDFIKEGNETKVCNVYKKTEMSFEHCIDRPDNIIIDRPI